MGNQDFSNFRIRNNKRIGSALKIYNASAGSGKTYTLVQEYLRIILRDKDSKKFRRILAMTFTNKAANEMKDRILQKLIELSKEDKSASERESVVKYSGELNLPPEKVEERAKKCLNAILHNYGMFSVMTIDKFTHRVIRTFAKELRLSLDFEVELDLETLRHNIADLLFDQIGRDPDVTRLMVSYADSNLQEDKSWNFKNSLIEFSKELFKEDALKAIQILSEYDTEQFIQAKKEIRANLKKFETQLQTNAQEALDIIHAKNLGPDDFQEKSRGVYPYLKKIAALFKIARPSKTVISLIEENKWGHKDSPNAATADEIGPLVGQYVTQIIDLFDTSYGDYQLNKELLKVINNLSLMNHLLKIIEEVKQQENTLLISDFYKKIADVIVKEPVPFIYERLGVRYEHFLLDEFQDTSHLQWVNLVPLLHNSLAVSNTNLIVGDGKQAIYRWRNGEVDQFVQLPGIYNPENIQSLQEAQITFKNEGHRVERKSNYRSAPEIVEFNNGLFKHLSNSMSEYVQEIYTTGEQDPVKKHKGYLEFKVLEDKDDQLQFQYVLGVIKRALDKGYQSQDICVLTKRNADGANMARYLTTAGLKVVSQDSLFVSKDLQVKFIFNLLASLTFPKSKNYAKKCIEHFDRIFDQPPHLFHLLDEEIDIVSWMKNQGFTLQPHAHFHSFYEFIEHLIQAYGFDAGQNIYLQFFLEQVHEFEKRHSSNVHKFIEWFNEKGYKESVQSPEGADAVKIMTIHKAKGLQFPIVICPFFDWNPTKNNSEKWITDSPGVLPAFPLKVTNNTRETIHRDTIEEEDIKHSLDQLNIVYVSFTRPETALFVCGSIKKQNPLIKVWLLPYLELDPEIIQQDNIWFKGEFTLHKTNDKTDTEPLQISFCKQIMDKPTLSTSGGEQWDIHDLDKKREYGTYLHLLLSKVEKVSEVNTALNELILKGLIPEEDREKLEADVKNLFEETHFQSYFSGEQVMNEIVIIDELGKKHIPDKLIISNDHVLVVDFKTGEGHSSSHKTQVKEYISLLKNLGYKNVSGELYYTENKEIIAVQS